MNITEAQKFGCFKGEEFVETQNHEFVQQEDFFKQCRR